MRKISLISIIILISLCVGLGTSCGRAQKHDAVIVDGPWDSLLPGTGSGLALEKEWGALTLQSDLTGLVFLLVPDPDKEARVNSVTDLETYDGRLYIGYGDIINNRGPVDIVSYDPLKGTLNREMLDVPEEAVKGWHIGEDGKLYVAGIDARESWKFGNFYVYDGKAWQKRRTIPSVSKVYGVVDFQGRLYAMALHIKPPVNYPFALVSEDKGLTWMYEPVDEPIYKESIKYSSVNFSTVTHTTGKFIYAKVWVCDKANYADCSGSAIIRLYRFDGKTWEQITILSELGKFTPWGLFAFGEKMLVNGNIYNKETAYRSHATYALDGKTQTEVTSLKDKQFRGYNCTVHDKWLYWIKQETTYDDPLRAWALYRTKDLEEWEKVGPIELLPGARPLCLGFVRSRLYVGAANAGWRLKGGHIELSPKRVYPIENAFLKWEAEVPDGAKLALKIRTVTNYRDIFNQPWVGPDGTEKTAYTHSGKALHPMHNGDTIFQAAIYKTPNSKNESPLIRRLTVETSKGSVTLAVDEGQGLYTAASTTDPDGVEYVSSIFRLKEPILGGGLFYEGAIPEKTSLCFQVRSAMSKEELTQKPFVGPDGAPSTFLQSSGERLWEGHNGGTFIQYRAVLTSFDPTLAPFLHKVALVTQLDRMEQFSF